MTKVQSHKQLNNDLVGFAKMAVNSSIYKLMTERHVLNVDVFKQFKEEESNSNLGNSQVTEKTPTRTSLLKNKKKVDIAVGQYVQGIKNKRNSLKGNSGSKSAAVKPKKRNTKNNALPPPPPNLLGNNNVP